MATKKKQTKKAPRKKFTWRERKAAVSAYLKSKHGEGGKVLKQHGVSYSLVHYWMANPETMRAGSK